MKPYVLRPRAREDRRAEVLYYRKEAGTAVASRLVKALARALKDIELNPGIGSPVLGKKLEIEELRTWQVDGFPLSFWYFEREHYVDVVRLVGQRRDPATLLDYY